MKTELIQTSRGKLTELIAESGKQITDAQETFFATTVYLSIKDSPENYREVTNDYVEQRQCEEIMLSLDKSKHSQIPGFLQKLTDC